MGLFLKKYYEGKVVVANDIGAINYLADIRLVDLVGLATKEPADRRVKQYLSEIKEKMFTPPQKKPMMGLRKFHEKLADKYGPDIAIIYDSWFKDGIPRGWIRKGKWKIRGNVICGEDAVSFYAINSEERDYLWKSLAEFSSELPKDVIQRYL